MMCWTSEITIVPGGCEHCGGIEGLDWRGGWTAYAWDPESGEPNPNCSRWYCEPCASDADDYWKGMWEEYHASRGC